MPPVLLMVSTIASGDGPRHEEGHLPARDVVVGTVLARRRDAAGRDTRREDVVDVSAEGVGRIDVREGGCSAARAVVGVALRRAARGDVSDSFVMGVEPYWALARG